MLNNYRFWKNANCILVEMSGAPRWLAAPRQQLEMGVRAGQQALAKWGLNYVIDEYLPRKLENRDGFSP